MVKYINKLNEVYEEEYDVNIARHTASHVLAYAIKRLYGNIIKFSIGPSTDNGFYYDFDNLDISVSDLENIESEMKKILKENIKVSAKIVDRDNAKEILKEEEYKLDILNEIDDDISFFSIGEFTDMCTGPHMLYIKSIGKFKLLSVTGAYFKGDEKNKMLTRIYGTCFENQELLDEYIKQQEEAKLRDHRKLGKELDLFMISEEGPGFPFFLPKGMVLRNILEDFWRKKHIENGYQEIKTPIMLNEDLWHRSGHWDHYKDNMYTTDIDESDFALKPMNCPGGMLVYKRKIHSYRDLPERVGELGIVHRHELSGALHGLMRVRCFTQDDAHIFCLPEQVEDEIITLMKLINEIYSIFGFKYSVELSTRPDDSMGTDKEWNIAIESLKNALNIQNIPYEINEGDGAFYGPKIDFHLKDSIGRTWQCGTIQLDFQMPEKFDLEYIGKDGNKYRPVMLHRVIFGSIERFIGILIEHFAGVFPLWLAPVQIKVLPISENEVSYCNELIKKLKENNLRVELDDSNNKIGYKIRETMQEKVPYMLVIGKKEVETCMITYRDRQGNEVKDISISSFIELIQNEIEKNN